MTRIGNKEKVNITISPYLKEKADELVATEKFSSMSDLVSIALAEFIGKYSREQKEQEMTTEQLLSTLSEKDITPTMMKILKLICEEGNVPNKFQPIIVDEIIE